MKIKRKTYYDRRDAFYRIAGFEPDYSQWEQYLKEDLETYGLEGIYCSPAICMEQIYNIQTAEPTCWPILEDLAGIEEGRILEFGAGVGVMIDQLLYYGANSVTAIETGFPLAFLNRLYESQYHVELYPDFRGVLGTFDISICFDVLEHLKQPVILKTVSKLVELTRPGGIIALNAPFFDIDPSYPLHLAENKNLTIKEIMSQQPVTAYQTYIVKDRYHESEASLWIKK